MAWSEWLSLREVCAIKVYFIYLDFIDAQLIWLDPNLLEVTAKTEDEPRFLVVGAIDKKHWSAVITYRNENIRIISVRRSRGEEVKLYES